MNITSWELCLVCFLLVTQHCILPPLLHHHSPQLPGTQDPGWCPPHDTGNCTQDCDDDDDDDSVDNDNTAGAPAVRSENLVMTTSPAELRIFHFNITNMIYKPFQLFQLPSKLLLWALFLFEALYPLRIPWSCFMFYSNNHVLLPIGDNNLLHVTWMQSTTTAICAFWCQIN